MTFHPGSGLGLGRIQAACRLVPSVEPGQSLGVPVSTTNDRGAHMASLTATRARCLLWATGVTRSRRLVFGAGSGVRVLLFHSVRV